MPFNRVQLISSSTIKWSDGTPFNGYVILIMALPTQGAQQWTQVALRNCTPKRKCPQRVKVPIKEGVYDTYTMLWSTDSLVPENVVYSCWFYDDTDQLIAIGSQLFQILAGSTPNNSPIPYTLNPPTLPSPTAALSSPQPGAAPSTQVNTVVYGAPIRENVSGTKNGVNTAFTIGSAVYQVVIILWNQTVLTAGVQYTLSGSNLSMIAPFLPGATDQLEDIRGKAFSYLSRSSDSSRHYCPDRLDEAGQECPLLCCQRPRRSGFSGHCKKNNGEYINGRGRNGCLAGNSSLHRRDRWLSRRMAGDRSLRLRDGNIGCVAGNYSIFFRYFRDGRMAGNDALQLSHSRP